MYEYYIHYIYVLNRELRRMDFGANNICIRFLKIVYCKQGAGTGVESRAGAPGLEKSRNRRKQKARFGWNVFGYSVCRPILLSGHLYVCIFVYLSVCLSVLNSNSNSLAVLHYFTFISLAML